MSTARLPINHGDTGKVSRDKINDSFNDVVNTVAGYRPHIEAGYWYIGTTNTGVKAKGDSVEMKEEDGYVWYKSESGQWTEIIAIEDLKGDKGDTGDAATITLGTVCTGAAGSDACITNSGTTCAAIFNFTIPQGATGCTGATGASICEAEFCGDDMVFTKDNGCTVTLCGAKNDLKGDTGSAATIEVGCVTTGEPGTSVCVCNSGTCCAAILDFTIPQGVKGDEGAAATITVGTTTTGESGTCACVTNTGTCNAAVLNFTIPKGAKGEDGCDGASICAAAFSGDDMVFTEDNGCTVTLANAKTCLKGDTGNAATVTVGSTTTGEPGGDACVTNSGTSCAAVLDFVIPTGATGPAGNGICSVTSTKAGKTTTVDITCTNGCSYCFQVQDGADGQGSGDMNASTYDPTNKSADAFDYCNFYHTPTIPTDNCQLANGCGYTTCTGTVTSSDLASYVTNACVACINGCCLTQGGDICIQGGTESNTKTFCMACNNDLVTAQAAYDWYKAGNNPIICYCQRSYITSGKDGNHLPFTSTNIYSTDYNSYGCTQDLICIITLCSADGTNVCSTYVGSKMAGNGYLTLNHDYTCPYTPQYAGSPATKKYVDDHDTVVSETAPVSATEGMLWYDTCNDVLKTYDGSCWNNAGGDSSNVKAFYISGNDKVTAQAAYDWYCSGKTPIIVCNNNVYTKYSESSSIINFVKASGVSTYCSSGGYNYLDRDSVVFCLSSGTVTCVRSTTTSVGSGSYLATSVNYANPYTPCYAGSPTTKKYVDEKVYTGDTAPVTAVEGQIWSDTCSNMVKYYDGAQWNALTAGGSTGTGDVTGPNSSVDGHIAVFDSTSGKIIKDGGPVPEGKSYCEGAGIDIEEREIRDRQGPAPDGFHVPSKDEWVDLIGILTDTFSMEQTYNTTKTYLKIPSLGTRTKSSSNIVNGSSGFYWSSTPYTTGVYVLITYSTGISTQNTQYYRSDGMPIRAFKDESVVPDSSWTTLYDGTSIAAGAGIFHNATLGLISVSGDGINWTTIADKNVGATTVYNNGDTVNASNGGGYFQRGNNYMFPYTGTVTTSDTKVDASCYGPGNYYCCSTFITSSASPNDWSCVQNDNLWGSVTNCCTSLPFINNTGVTSVNGCTGVVCLSIPTNNCELANGCGYTTCTGTLTSSNISDTAYGSSWNGVTTVAPSKNAVYDKIESVISSIPTNNNQLTNGCGYTTCTGTITGICMNGASKGTSGAVNLGTVITAETVVSGDTGCTYTIKKATTAPVSASNNTITFVTE